MTNGEICALLSILSVDANLFGAMLHTRSFFPVIVNVIMVGVAGYFCHAAATGSGSTFDTVTLGLLALLSGVLTLLAFNKPRRWSRPERGS